jgi:hypothetical protein
MMTFFSIANLSIPTELLYQQSLEELVDSAFKWEGNTLRAAECVLFVRPAKSIRGHDYISVEPVARWACR